jgi:hypothetical protein
MRVRSLLRDHNHRRVDVTTDEIGITEASTRHEPNGRSGCRSTLRKGIANVFNKAIAFCNVPTCVNNAPGFALHKRSFAPLKKALPFNYSAMFSSSDV